MSQIAPMRKGPTGYPRTHPHLVKYTTEEMSVNVNSNLMVATAAPLEPFRFRCCY